MRYLVIFVLVISSLLASSKVFADEDINLYLEEIRLEERRQDKLFNVTASDEVGMEINTFYDDLSSLPYYPIIMLDFFNIYHNDYYTDKVFTFVFKDIFIKHNTVLGIKLRMTVGYNR